MNKQIRFLDTTLRDGEQTPGIHMSTAAKVEIATQLARLRVDVIEAGFPAVSEREAAAVSQIASAVKNATVCGLARANRADILTCYEALRRAEDARIHTFIATSDLHMRAKLRLEREEVLSRIRDAVSYAASLCPDVEFSAEDATRSDRDFLCAAVSAAVEAGASVINLPDTVGYLTPEEMAALVRYVREHAPIPDHVQISVHCHNDLGLAVAGSLAAIDAGAVQIEGTVNGLGERAGNAALEEVIMALHTRADHYGVTLGVDTTQITRTSRLISSLTGLSPSANKAIVGKNAFLHESGIHQHGMMCDRATYEIIRPETIGLSAAGMPLGKLSGRHAFAQKVKALGYELDDASLGHLFSSFKDIAAKKPEITDGDVAAIVNDYLDSRTGDYKLDSFQIQSGNRIMAMAMITLIRLSDGVLLSEAAVGHGPIDAAFNALGRIVGADAVTLESYNINAVTEGADALGEVTVKIKDEDTAFSGRAVSSDIIKASIKAYLHAVNKWLAVKRAP